MANNPFELEGRKGGPARPHASREWTPEEQAERLEGYLEVPPAFWEHIRYGTHLRYYTKDGTYRPGGFVRMNPFDATTKSTGATKRCMKLQNSFNSKMKGYSQWPVVYEDTSRIFIKPEAGVLVAMSTIEDAVKGLNENIRKLTRYAKQLEKRIAALEERK
jgi:hypothetical protein